MPLTDADIEAIALKEYPKAKVVSIDGRILHPTAEQVIEKWAHPETLARYGEAESAKTTAFVKLQLPQQSPPVPESLLRRTLIVDRERGVVVGQSG
jgi:hypothetical protein